jgi:LacI family transcriptional regulator
MGRVTLQTIAEHLGVSKYAVSRSLAGKDGVSEATRKTVERAARELGYTAPGHLSHARTIQLVLHDHDPVNSEVQLRIQRGIQHEAERAGHPVQLQWTHEPERIFEIGRHGAGMILVGPHTPIDPKAPGAPKVPVVKVGLIAPLEPVDQVNPAVPEATAALGLKLLDYGHRRILYLQGKGGYRGRAERFNALAGAIAGQPGVKLRELFFAEDGGFLPAFEALRAGGFAPTAILAGNDGMAVGAISDLMRIGLKVPEDISVVGYGDYASATQITPQLTTIRVPGEQMGAAALQMLTDRMQRRDLTTNPYRRLLIYSPIIERQSLRRI